MLIDESRFYHLVREERMFCGILAHLLLQRGPNLASFLRRMHGDAADVSDAAVERAEVYVEFSYLRDRWSALGHDNAAKRNFVERLFSRVPSLEHLSDDALPVATWEYNAHFVGPKGERIRRDIASPHHWTLPTLAERYGENPETFRDLCRLKWSFTIKPDLVVLVPGLPPLCVEAKLESGEGRYPTRRSECACFDGVCGPDQRVGQVELQQFMFDRLLGMPCKSVVIGRTPVTVRGATFHRWDAVLGEMELSASIPFVGRLLAENTTLGWTAP